jgi:hypothetical protein
MAALVLSLSCALGAAGCVQEPDTSPETLQETSANEEITPVSDGPIDTSAEPINEACLQACLDANQRAVDLCMRIRSIGARKVCIIAANAVMATCIANCPDE